jgi:fatty acid desaturase
LLNMTILERIAPLGGLAASLPGPRPAPVPDPRETMRALPSWLQLPLTFLTGKPHRDQPRPALSPTFHVVSGFGSLAAGVALGALGLAAGGAGKLLLPLSWAVTLHGMRDLRMLVFHQCAHRNLYGRRELDRPIGQLISSLLIIQNFERYSKEHTIDHHAAPHMTLRDPTVQAVLLGLELRAGMPRERMWPAVLRKIVSPAFHARFTLGRLRSFSHGSSRTERALAVGIYAAALAAALAGGWLPQLLLLWAVPLVPLFQVSNTLRLCVKHTFPAAGTTARTGKEHFAGLTNAIFVGEPAPAPAPGWRGAAAWARWWLRMLAVHLPARYLVLTGDTVVHDFHHRHPTSKRWPSYLFARRDDSDTGHAGWPAYREVWGLRAGIDAMFDSLAAADPAEFDPARIGTVSGRHLYEAFED